MNSWRRQVGILNFIPIRPEFNLADFSFPCQSFKKPNALLPFGFLKTFLINDHIEPLPFLFLN